MGGGGMILSSTQQNAFCECHVAADVVHPPCLFAFEVGHLEPDGTHPSTPEDWIWSRKHQLHPFIRISVKH